MSQKQIRPGEGTPADAKNAQVFSNNEDAARKAKEAKDLLAKMEADKRVRDGGGGGSGRRGCCGCC